MKRYECILRIVICFAFPCLLLIGACGGGGGDRDGAQIPVAPTGLQVDSTTLDSVTLSWTDNATNETGFRVESGPTSLGPFTAVATPGQDEETYTQSTLISGRYYFYRVCACNTDGDSPFSDVVLATTELGPGGGYPIPAFAESLKNVEVYAIDSNGYSTTYISYIGPGTDSAWGTSDDEIENYCIPTRNPDHTVDFGECYGVGNDGDWFTGDDPVATYSTYAYDSTGNRIQMNRYNDPGSDMIWGTGDDQMDRYELYSNDSSNRRTKFLRVSNPGGDGDWFTPDDVVTRVYKIIYDADGYGGMRISSLDPGGDGEWFTSDDVVYSYDTIDYDSLGRQSRRYTWNDGNDGKWFTEDDEITGHRISVRDSNGSLLGEYYYFGVYYYF